jgi:hypothetical protein
MEAIIPKQDQTRWRIYENFILQVVKPHKRDCFNMINQMNQQQLEAFVGENYDMSFQIIKNSTSSAQNARLLSQITYAKNLLRLLS